jgi:hypothetical protein
MHAVPPERAVGNDVFLRMFREEFLDNARYLISEAYVFSFLCLGVWELTPQRTSLHGST